MAPTPHRSTPSKRQAAAELTRERMLDAGLRLAEQVSLGELSVNLIVAEAGVSKGSFFHHFGDRTSYLIALHRGFHERLMDETLAATEDTDPGRERLGAGARRYLDVCLRAQGVRALSLDARAEPEIADEVQARNRSASKLFAEDFRAIGSSHPLQAARLWIGMLAEAALLEREAGRRRPAVRAALAAFITADAWLTATGAAPGA